jgi:hypothetical protein
MNIQIAVAAVAVIGFAMFSLIGMWVYSQIKRTRVKRKDKDLIVVHRFKSAPRHRKRALSAPAPNVAPADNSQWRRPGFTTPIDPTARPALPLYEQGKPRHVLVLNTPTIILPHETVGPNPPVHPPEQQRVSRRNQPTVMIKTIRVDAPVAERTQPTRTIKTLDEKGNKYSKVK